MAGSRRLDINLHFDTTESDRQQAAARAKSKQMSDALISDADAAERAKLEFVKRSNAQKIQELSKSAKTEVEIARDAASASLKAQKDADAARIKADKEAAAAKTKAEKDAAAESMRVANDEAAFAKKMDDLRIAADKKVAQSAIQAQREKVREATRFLQQEEKAHDKVTSSAFGTVKQLFQMGAAFLGLQSASSVMAAMMHDLDKTAAYAQKTAEEIFKIRGAVRELAALRGEMGNTGPTTAHVLGVAAQTLQTPEDVTGMEQAAIGIGELAIGKSISKEDLQKSMVASGRLATLEGGDSKAYGALAGQIALQSDHIMNDKEMEAELFKTYQIFKPGGFINGAQGAEQYAKLNPLIMSGVYKPNEAKAVLSAMSVGSPGESSTMAENFAEATLAGRIRARGMKLDPDLDTEKSFEYLKRIGAGEDDDAMTIGKKIAADFKVQEGVGAKSGHKFNALTYLTEHGFGNKQHREAIMAMTGLVNTGRFDPIAEAASAPLNFGANGGGAISELFTDRAAKDPYFQTRQAETLDLLATAKQGLEEEPYEIARKSAFAYLKDNHAMYGKYEDWTGHSPNAEKFLDIGALRSDSENSYAALRGTTHTFLRNQAERLGINPDDETGQFGGGVEWDQELARRVQHAGGDLTGGAAKSMARSAEKISAAVDRLEKAVNPKGPPAPIRGKPVQPVMRPQ